MGLFRKNLSEYRVMEKYKKRLDDFYIFGETEKYRLFLDKQFNQYILRQEKQNPKNVVTLGWLRGNVCVFHDRIFYINKWSYTGRSENPLNYIDIETGNAGSMSVLSNKGCWIAMHWHCQDNVNSFTIQGDKLVIEVTRYKENAHNEEEFSYSVHIKYADGQFQINYVFPEKNTQNASVTETNTMCERKIRHPDEAISATQSQNNSSSKKYYSIADMAGAMAEICIHELVDIMGICSKHNVHYDEKKLIIATFAYFYTVWLFNFANITAGQADALEETYKEKFSLFNRKQYENEPFKNVIENEHLLAEQLVRVDRRVRSSYHANSHTFVDDGISDDFILEFVDSQESKEIIKAEIVIKILKDWAYKATIIGQEVAIDNN